MEPIEQGMAAAVADSAHEQNKDELFRIKAAELEEESKKIIASIQNEGHAYRNILSRQIRDSVEMEEVNVTVCKLRLVRDKKLLREAIYGEKPTVGSIRMLPIEMLSCIFRHHVDSGSSPWILTKVSKAWLHAAMMTPQLWCHILVSTARHSGQTETYVVDGKKYVSSHNWHVCCDVAQVRDALRRSGAVALKLALHQDRWAQESIPAEILRILLSSPISERIYSLDIKKLSTLINTDIVIGRFPVLREIKLPFALPPWGHGLLNSVSLTARHLESASLMEGLPERSTTYDFWSRIKRLSMRSYQRNAERLNKVAGRLVRLEYADGLPDRWPNATTPTCTWSHVKEVNIRCDSRYLGQLELPVVETLSFSSMDHQAGHPLGAYSPILYPRLNTLDLAVSDPKWPEYTAGAFPAVETLTLTCNGGDELILNILQTMPQVRNIAIRSSIEDFGLLLMQSLRSRARGKICCPKLERLRLGSEGQLVQTLRSVGGPLAKQLVEFRIQKAKPLLEAIVHWRYRKEVIDYAALV